MRKHLQTEARLECLFAWLTVALLLLAALGIWKLIELIESLPLWK